MPHLDSLRTIILLLLLALAAAPALADETAGAEEPTEEEAEEEKEGGKFLALPIFITEPAIGEGLGAGLAFAGAGYTDTSAPIFDTDNNIRAGGVGVRYMALESQNVWVGLDLAWGPEDEAWYIQVGHPW